MGNIYFDITVIICLAAVLSILFRMLKQPLILAYILTGIILGPLGLVKLGDTEALHTLGQLGITFLLFMLGLELRLKELKSIGKPVLIVGTLQVWFTFVTGFFLAFVLGLPKVTALYIGIGLAFSSTIIVVKSLSDKKDLNSLHGKLSIGVLLLQDFFAVLTIILLTGMKGSSGGVMLLGSLVWLLVKVFLLFGVIGYLSATIFPRITHALAKSSELLFLFSLAWVFALTAFVTSPYVGFSIEIGGFLAGLALANSAENFQILARMKALRDFFITIFFVILGLEMTFNNIFKVLPLAVVFSFFVLAVKPFLVMVLTGLLGYRKRTSFLVGINLGQVSEFTFILMFLGNTLGYISSEVVTTVLLVGIISFVLSTYLLQHTHHIFKAIQHHLNFLEAKHIATHEQSIDQQVLADMTDHIVLIGGHQMGQSIIHALEETKEQVVVVDFDPDIVKKLQGVGIPTLFGDIADPEIQERVGVDKAKLIISTIPDTEDNLVLIHRLNHENKKAKIVVMAFEVPDAKTLYKAGADYVVLPHLAGGRHLAKLLVDSHLEDIERFKKKDMEYLK